MTALEILHILQPFQEFLIQLQQSEAVRQPQHEWDYSLSLSYTFITLKIFRGTKDDTNKDLYVQIIFRMEHNKIFFSEIYYPDGIDTHRLTEEIKSNKMLHARPRLPLQEETVLFSDEVRNYLSIADRISQHAVNMNAGDSYWPGNYSNVKCTTSMIVLEQINHMNSRSINHKEDYSLRDLIFYIPLQNVIPFKQSYNDVLLGMMLVNFSDRSSQNNRAAGDAIQEQIEKELQNTELPND